MGSIVDVPGVRVGHAHDEVARTGCTVVVYDAPVSCGVDVRGGAPGTRETDVLQPLAHVEVVHAIVLSGGSAFGLDAASGVTNALADRGVGYEVGAWRVPIVPAAVIFDLFSGNGNVRPDKAMGARAFAAASTALPAEGAVGVGSGALVAKLGGLERGRPGGVGCAAIRYGDVIVGAIAVCNAVGNVFDWRTGQLVAAPRDGNAPFNLHSALARPPAVPGCGANTTLAVVATNASLRKADAGFVARMAHDGLARAIVPSHLTRDGDTIFACGAATVGIEAQVDLVGALAAEAVADAIVRGVRAAS